MPAAAYDPAQHDPILFWIGDIGVSRYWVVTPNGSRPLAGSQWIVRDGSHLEERTPAYAVVIAVVLSLACLLGLLFLLVKQRRMVCYIEVTVRTGDMYHVTRLPGRHPLEVDQVRRLVHQAQSMAHGLESGSTQAQGESHSVAFDAPWSSLVVEAARAVDRTRRAAARARGPAAARIADAVGETSIAADSARKIAARARDLDETLRSMNLTAMEQHLAALTESGGESADVDAVRRSIKVQQEAAERMKSSRTRLLGQLERLVAQLGEAATHAEELALGSLPPDDPAPGLTNAIDGLVAIRAALDTVENAVGNQRR